MTSDSMSNAKEVQKEMVRSENAQYRNRGKTTDVKQQSEQWRQVLGRQSIKKREKKESKSNKSVSFHSEIV